MNKLSIYNYLFIAALAFAGCGKSEDPQPVNEEEVITTILVTLTPVDNDESSTPITFLFVDEDGEVGEKNPAYIISGPLAANTGYNATITIKNQTTDPETDITFEINEEATDHLFCYTSSGIDLSFQYTDKDKNDKPLGLKTIWTTGNAGTGSVNIVLRHQPGTKTGECPGSGESDVDVTFSNVIIE